MVVPDEGERRLLAYVVNKTAPTNLVLRLYTNSLDLSTETWNSASLTEASGAGYSSATLTGANWTISTVAGVTAAVYNTTVTFSFSEARDIQGYYLTDSSGAILWGEGGSGGVGVGVGVKVTVGVGVKVTVGVGVGLAGGGGGGEEEYLEAGLRSNSCFG